MSRIIAITNQKGGVGKTTTAVNLSAAIACAGLSVLLIDLDPQANATSGIGADPAVDNPSHPLVAGGSARLRPQPTDIAGLCLVPSSSRLLALEGELSGRADGAFRLKLSLEAGFDADYVIVDCPPSLGILTTNALNAASGVLIPIQCEYYAMEGLTQVLRALNDTAAGPNPALHLEGIVLTMFDPDLALCGEVASEVRNYFPEDTYDTIIPRDVALSEAASFGRSVFDYAPRGPGSLAYIELAKEVMSNG